MEDDLLQLAQERFERLVLGDGECAKIQFVCAETGMGKTLLAQGLIARYQRKGLPTRYVSLASMGSDAAAGRVVRLARELSSAAMGKADRKLAVLDDVPPFDECDLGRVVRALGRMVARNALVIVCLLPEALVLAEEMPGTPMITSADLADVFCRPDGFGGTILSGLTAGIAALELVSMPGEALSSARSQATFHDPMAYREALARLAANHVRETLPLEEQRLRLAMLLMGGGTAEELSSVVGRIDPDELSTLRAHAPLLGVKSGNTSFKIVGSQDERCLDAMAQGLRDACARMPETVAAAAQALLARGELNHGAAVMTLCSPQDQMRLGCSWGVELVCAGEVPIVREALCLHEQGKLDPTTPQLLAEKALALLCDASARLDERPLKTDGLAGREAWQARAVELLRACRDLDRCLSPRSLPSCADETGMLGNLCLHVRTRRLLLQGRGSEAYTLLVNCPARLAPRTLPEALLADDFHMAQMLTGEAPHVAEQQAYDVACALLARCGIERLSTYARALGPALMVLAGRATELEGLEVAIQHASRMGDNAVCAAFLLVGAVLDNRRGAYPRAHVRAVQAADLLSGRLGQHLLRMAHLVDALAALGLGDDTPAERLARGHPSAIRDLTALLVADSDEVARMELSTLSRTVVDPDTLWLLNVLCNDLGDRSRLFRQAIPAAWSATSRRSVRRMQAMERQQDKALPPAQAPRLPLPGAPEVERPAPGLLRPKSPQQSRATLARPPVEGPSTPRQGHDVRVVVLGGFEVWVNGQMIPSARFMRRRARALMTMLAIAPGHQMRRYELLDAVWPESDFDNGRQHIYEATSVARNLMRSVSATLPDPFVSVRYGGSIMLEPALVTCDVDEFERLARDTIAEEDATKAASLACRVMELYRGDLCETPYDTTGRASARREELRELFADAATAGAQAALHDHQTGLAVRLAQAAHEASDLREDVILALVGALRAAGRPMDAREAYRAFAKRLLDATGEPPSASLRSTVGDLFPQLSAVRQGKVTPIRAALAASA